MDTHARPLMPLVQTAAFVLPVFDIGRDPDRLIHGDDFRYIPCEAGCRVMFQVWGWEFATQSWKLLDWVEFLTEAEVMARAHHEKVMRETGARSCPESHYTEADHIEAFAEEREWVGEFESEAAAAATASL